MTKRLLETIKIMKKQRVQVRKANWNTYRDIGKKKRQKESHQKIDSGPSTGGINSLIIFEKLLILMTLALIHEATKCFVNLPAQHIQLMIINK